MQASLERLAQKNQQLHKDKSEAEALVTQLKNSMEEMQCKVNDAEVREELFHGITFNTLVIIRTKRDVVSQSCHLCGISSLWQQDCDTSAMFCSSDTKGAFILGSIAWSKPEFNSCPHWTVHIILFGSEPRFVCVKPAAVYPCCLVTLVSIKPGCAPKVQV